MADARRLDEHSLPDYLRGVGLLPAAVDAQVEPAGDGNINWVRRVSSEAGSWIVKQARPALERFPEYRVSTERIVFEARYFERARALDPEGVCPEVLHFDAEARVLVLGDLGAAPRLDHELARGADGRAAGERLARFLGRVHAGTGGLDPAEFANDEMRRLHGDHIFALPFRTHDFPLPPALRSRAEAIWRDGSLAELADGAYRRYLDAGEVLVHGDVQAGNVLLPPAGAVLLDAEIAHLGDPGFDMGTLIAHLLLPAVAAGRPERAAAAVSATWQSYLAVGGRADPEATARYAALEMLRRTLGAARVPAVEAEVASLAVLDFAEPLVGEPDRLGLAAPAQLSKG